MMAEPVSAIPNNVFFKNPYLAENLNCPAGFLSMVTGRCFTGHILS